MAALPRLHDSHARRRPKPVSSNWRRRNHAGDKRIQDSLRGASRSRARGWLPCSTTPITGSGMHAPFVTCPAPIRTPCRRACLPLSSCLLQGTSPPRVATRQRSVREEGLVPRWPLCGPHKARLSAPSGQSPSGAARSLKRSGATMDAPGVTAHRPLQRLTVWLSPTDSAEDPSFLRGKG